MISNLKLISELLKIRKHDNDPITMFATRSKDSEEDVWNDFQTFNTTTFLFILSTNIDGVKLKFKNTTVTFNARHKTF